MRNTIENTEQIQIKDHMNIRYIKNGKNKDLRIEVKEKEITSTRCTYDT